jgi:hypothetical protein
VNLGHLLPHEANSRKFSNEPEQTGHVLLN